MVDSLSYFSFQPVLHIWCNTGSGMYYPVFEMVHVIGSLLLSERVADEVAEADFLSC